MTSSRSHTPTGTSRCRRPRLLPGPNSSCTPLPGRTSTVPRTIRRAHPRSTSEERRTPSRSALRSSTTRRTTSSTAASASRMWSPTARTPCPPTRARSSTVRPLPASGPGSSARRGSSAPRATTSSARCSGSEPSGTKWRSSTTSGARRRSSATSPPRRAELLEQPYGVWHVAAAGDCTWADFAEAIFEEAGLSCRVRRISTAELGRPAPRPAYSVLRSEKPSAPELPHWREGLRETLAAIQAGKPGE